MQRLFLGIYGSVLLAICLVLALSYASFSTLNQYRYQQHMSSLMTGTLHLLTEGALRQTYDDRERWLSLAASLMGVKLTVIDSPFLGEQAKVIKLSNDKQQESYQLLTKLGAQQTLVVELNNIDEQVISATAFLVLNELGRSPAKQRQQKFEQLVTQFSYPIARISSAELNFDSEQQERLARGETIVVWQTELGHSLYIDVYAPWGDSNDVLKLGAINFFEPYPTWLITLGLLIALVFLAIWVMMIIQKLSNQLMLLQRQVDSIEPEYLSQQPSIHNQDLVAQLKWKIDSMSARIQKLLDQKSYMIRAVSHDLRTPLSKAQFRLESLAIELGSEHPKLLATKQNLKQLNLMIDELLSYEKLSQNQTIKFETIDIVTLTKQICDDNQLIYPNVQFNFDSDQNSFNVELNQPLFTRMLENLITNAARYCHKRVELKVFTLPQQDHLELAIIDDGEGISSQAKESIFDPFFQEEQSRSNKTAGYGLGLAIVKQIVIQHNAQIQLLDTAGAHFVIKLPKKQGGL